MLKSFICKKTRNIYYEIYYLYNIFILGKYLSKSTKAFTLVELIIVITILAILATIAFVSFQNYTKDARDTNRLTTLKNIESGLQTFQITTGNYPEPDDRITIQSSGIILNSQGKVGDNVSKMIKINKTPLDPFDQEKYLYSSNALKTKYQLLSYLEGNNQTAYINQGYALDYIKRSVKSIGNTLGIIMDSNNIPITANIDIGNANSGTVYKTVFSNTDIVSFSGYPLASIINTRQGDAPKDCPEGFISVPGNAEFNTAGGFCVAKYEMGYADGLIPDSNIGGTAFNSMKYISGKKIGSIPGVYPIADISAKQAIDACKSMGLGYTLLTNNQRMTIARSIEFNNLNWTENNIGSGFIYNGISGDLTYGCDATGGNTETRSFATKTGDGTDLLCNKRRKYILLNRQEIRDFAGNLREYVTLNGVPHTLGSLSISGSSDSVNWDHDGIYNQDDMKKYGSALGLGMSAGLGSVYRANGVGSDIILRSSIGHNSAPAGIYTISLNVTSDFQSRSMGFRCAYINN